MFCCIICKGTEADIRSVRDAKDGASISIALCSTCGHVQLANVPSTQTLEAFYRTEYRRAYRRADAPKPKHVYRAGSNASARISLILPHVDKGTRLLDIGAGGGEFVYLAARSGLQAQGIDPASGYLEFARENYGAELRGVGVDELEAEERYGLVTLFHVLEHLPDPVGAIATIADHLEPDGLLYLEVPDLCAKDTSPTNLWFKAHISYFTPLTLALLVTPHFEVLQTHSGRVLEMILRKRPAPIAVPDLSSARNAAVELSRQRMAGKTFGEYLANGGMTAIFRSAARALREYRQTGNRSAKEVLDAFLP